MQSSRYLFFSSAGASLGVNIITNTHTANRAPTTTFVFFCSRSAVRCRCSSHISTKNRAFGPQAALLTLKPLFEKRQQLLLAMSASDGVVGPGLALLSSRRRKLHALKRNVRSGYSAIFLCFDQWHGRK